MFSNLRFTKRTDTRWLRIMIRSIGTEVGQRSSAWLGAQPALARRATTVPNSIGGMARIGRRTLCIPERLLQRGECTGTRIVAIDVAKQTIEPLERGLVDAAVLLKALSLS